MRKKEYLFNKKHLKILIRKLKKEINIEKSRREKRYAEFLEIVKKVSEKRLINLKKYYKKTARK